MKDLAPAIAAIGVIFCFSYCSVKERQIQKEETKMWLDAGYEPSDKWTGPDWVKKEEKK